MTPSVKAYAGSTNPEHPRSFDWEGQEFQVESILDRWRKPDSLGFLVRCLPGRVIFELIYKPQDNQWEIHPKGSVIIKNNLTK